jgi:putative transposase
MERRKPRPHAHPVKLSSDERSRLKDLTRKGIVSAREVTRARILLLLDEGWAPTDVPEAVGCNEATVRRVRARYEKEGLDRALTEGARPGHAKALSDKQEAHIIAMVCSEPPDGHARWTIRLVTEQAIRRGIVDTVGKETIRVLLRDHDLKPWREKNVVRSQARRGVHREDGGRARGVRAGL